MTGGAGDGRAGTGEDGVTPDGPAGPDGVARDGATRVRRGPVAWLWFSAGWFAVALGSLGVIVPGLPTTVFFIVAAACFARCSPRFERWVLDLPRIGPMVRDHRAGLGMRRRAKVAAVTTILAVSTVSGVFLIANRAVGLAVVGVGLVGAAYVLFRVPTRERVVARRLPSAPPAEAI